MWELVWWKDHRRAVPTSLPWPVPCPAGEGVVAYLTGVLMDLLHTQRDPLALCLLLQSYDKLEPPVPPCCRHLAQFNRYYSLWIPEPAREALVSCRDHRSRGSQACLSPESAGVSPLRPQGAVLPCSLTATQLTG